MFNYLDDTYFKVVFSVPNNGDGNHQKDVYEFLFNNSQIVSLKHYQLRYSSSAEFEKLLVESTYYTVNLLDEEELEFPAH